MKFDILKFILGFSIIFVFVLEISLQSKIGLTTNLKAGMFLRSNLKLSLENSLAKLKKNSTISSELDKVNSKILFRGWLKYFKFLDEDQSSQKPKQFFKNKLYERDSKRKHKGDVILFK